MLEGEVEWNFQRDDVTRAIRRLTGVIGINNLITVKPRLKAIDVGDRIEYGVLAPV